MPPVVALRIYYFVAFGAFGLYLPFFPAWLEARGFHGATMSALVSLTPLLSLTSPPLVGIMADRFGLRGKIMTIAAIGTATGVSLLALSAGAFEPLPFWAAFASVLLFAIFRSPTTGMADVLAMEIAHNYGRMRLFGSLGFLTMALVGGQFVDVEDPVQLPAMIAGCLWLLTVVSRILPRASGLPPRPALKDALELLRQPGFRWLLITTMLIFGSTVGYDLCASLKLRGLGASSGYVGAFWAFATASEVLLMFWAAPFVAKIGPGKLLTVSCLVATGRWYFLSKATSLTLIMAMQPLHALSFGLMWVSAMATLKRELGPRGTATGQGVFSSAVAVGAYIGLWAWGLVYASHGSRVVFLSASVVAGASALVASRLIRWSGPATFHT